ncbi:hypothetical protein O9929_12195 [Vibrio lentus]|nr:hypothetical protein [Vibrio lentus]
MSTSVACDVLSRCDSGIIFCIGLMLMNRYQIRKYQRYSQWVAFSNGASPSVQTGDSTGDDSGYYFRRYLWGIFTQQKRLAQLH